MLFGSATPPLPHWQGAGTPDHGDGAQRGRSPRRSFRSPARDPRCRYLMRVPASLTPVARRVRGVCHEVGEGDAVASAGVLSLLHQALDFLAVALDVGPSL